MTETKERPKFWSDDFDMDLLKVFPQTESMLQDPDATLWTVGHESFGRLNHPCTWNGPIGAFCWLEKPSLPRDEHGWFSVGGCVADEVEIECTWLEWLRDAWSLHYTATILPNRINLPAMQWRPFEQIMYDLRGWHKQDVSAARKEALCWLMRCEFLFNEARRGVMR